MKIFSFFFLFSSLLIAINALDGDYVLDLVETPRLGVFTPQRVRNPMFVNMRITQRNSGRHRLVISLDPRSTGTRPGQSVTISARIERNGRGNRVTVSRVRTSTNNPGPRTRSIMDALRATQFIAENSRGDLFFRDSRGSRNARSRLEFSALSDAMPWSGVV